MLFVMHSVHNVTHYTFLHFLFKVRDEGYFFQKEGGGGAAVVG